MRPLMYLKQSPLVDCLPAHPEERRRNPRREVQGVIFLKILKSDLRSEPIRSCLIDLSAAAFRASHSSKELCSRSEEHTSELQSRLHLVCRLLLEKKKPTQALSPPQLI